MIKNINIITWNARGINHKSYELFDFLIDNNIHTCLATETWLKNNISLSHKNFFVYRNDRVIKKGGGVAIIIKKNLSHSLLPLINTSIIENIGIKLYTINGPVDIYSCYFAGGLVGIDGLRKQKFKSDIYKLSRSNYFILGGDFNSRHQSWGCVRSNCWGNTLYEKQNSYIYDIIYPKDHTHIPSQSNRQSSTLDIFLTNITQNISTVEVLYGLGSDHLPVKCQLNRESINSQFFFRDFKKANWKLFSKYINKNIQLPSCQIIESCELIDAAIENFTNINNHAISHSVPLRTQSFLSKKLPQNIQSLITDRNYHRRQWVRYRFSGDFQLVKSLNSQINTEIEKFRNNKWNDLLQSLDKGSSPFWNLTKIIRKKSKTIPILVQNNTRFSTSAEKCEVLAQTFKANHCHSVHLSDSATETEVNNTIREFNANCILSNDVNTDLESIGVIIKSLKNKKAPGIDGINNLCLKALPKNGIKYLTILINSCIYHGYFPEKFKEAKVIPIRKPNKPANCPESYRPISLLSSISKILEKVIKCKITNHLDDNNVLPPQQFGFRREHNTMHPLVRIRNIVKSSFSQQKSTGMILLDIKAAFDSVWHNALVYKLIKLNFNINIIKLIQSFLSDRSFKVHIGSKCSSSIQIIAGVPQGSCLSPILYNIFTSDIPLFENCTYSIFADDTAILCSDFFASEILRNLQLAFEQLCDYFSKWKISLNYNKTQAIYFTRKRKECFVPQSMIKINNNEIKWEKNVKYLGLILDTKLTFNDHVSYIVQKCKNLIKILYPFINKASPLSKENKMLIFKAIFHAVMFYAAPVWAKSANCHIKKIQIMQNKILKLILNKPWYFSTVSLHQTSNVEFISEKLLRVTNNFNTKCIYSVFNHLTELAS